MTETLRTRLHRLRSALPSSASAVTLTREDLDELLGRPDEVDPVGDLTVQDIARELGKAESTVRTWLTSHGGIPGAYKLHGHEWRVPPSALREYLRRGGKAEEPDDLPSWDEV